MTAELTELIDGRRPLSITDVEFHDPAFVLVGEGWSAAVVCPWRIVRGGLLETSIDDPSAERRLRELVGEEVRSVVALLERADAQDLALVLSDI